MTFWLTVLGAGLGALATSVFKELFGFYVNKSSQVESDRDEDRDAIVTAVFEVRDLASEYWTTADTAGDTTATAGAITGRITQIAILIDDLFAEDKDLSKAVTLDLNRFDSCITRGDFQVLDRPSESQRVAEIEDTAYRLTESAKRCRRKLDRKLVRLRRTAK